MTCGVPQAFPRGRQAELNDITNIAKHLRADIELITWLVITWATDDAQRTTAALEKTPQASMEQCLSNSKVIKNWQPKASVKCIEGIRGF